MIQEMLLVQKNYNINLSNFKMIGSNEPIDIMYARFNKIVQSLQYQKKAPIEEELIRNFELLYQNHLIQLYLN